MRKFNFNSIQEDSEKNVKGHKLIAAFEAQRRDAGPSQKKIKMEGVEGEVESGAKGEGGSAEAPILTVAPNRLLRMKPSARGGKCGGKSLGGWSGGRWRSRGVNDSENATTRKRNANDSEEKRQRLGTEKTKCP